ncbi:hypothetical protein [Leptospira sp. id769339]|nr:hypothetical protein [Leptospira sp. id769339]EMJ97961.1 hypothetical protein LEP1GSC192_0567 [Leptospira sp. B5-022]MCR1795145.1 hypothetical protein [Leptospira sp. id769339]
MKRFPILFLCVLYWNCFTAATFVRHDGDLNAQRIAIPYLSESAYEITEIKRSKSELFVSYKTGFYIKTDRKFKYTDRSSVCTPIQSLGPNYFGYSYADISSSLSSTCDLSSSPSAETLPFEEIKDLKNGIWFPDLDIILYSEKGLDTGTNHLPAPNQFSKEVFIPQTGRYRSMNFLKQFKSTKIESSLLCHTQSIGHRYLRLVTDKKEAMILFSAGDPFEIFLDNKSRPVSDFTERMYITDCEPLKVRSYTLPKNAKVIAIQFPVPDKSEKWKMGTKVYQISGNMESFPNGIIAISKPSNSLKKDDKVIVWSAYPILYPFSVSLDIVTSPIQLVSILLFGFDGHLLLSSCLLGGRCRSPLG